MSVLFTNNAVSSLASGISAGATLLNVQPGDAELFPNPTPPDYFVLTLEDRTVTPMLREILKVTARVGAQMTVQRAQEGTTARAFNAGVVAALRLTAGTLAAVAAIQANGDLKIDAGKQILVGTTPITFVGEIKMWGGSLVSIPTGWHLCDGTSGTPDLRDRFIVGAGGAYAVAATGGVASNTLSIAQLPAHSHGVTDPGHSHGTADAGHGHSVIDSGHTHQSVDSSYGATVVNSLGGTGQAFAAGAGNLLISGDARTASNGTGVSIGSSTTGIGISNNVTSLTTNNTGSGNSVENRPPYYALCFIQRIT